MQKKQRLKALRANWWIGLILVALAMSCILPILHTVALSVSDQALSAAGKVYLLPKGFNLNSYDRLFRESIFLTAFGISILRVVLALVISGGVTILAAFALSREPRHFRGRNAYLWILVFTMLFNAGTIPWYMAIKTAGLLDTIWALILPCAVSAYNIILMMNFFRGIPPSLEESAVVDGAGPWRTLLQIYVPLSKPSIATIALFIVVYHWNNFYDGLVLMSRPAHYPLQTYIYQLTVTIDVRTVTNIEALREMMKVSGLSLNAAKLVVSMLPILMIYPLLQRYFVTGLTLGAVKE